MIPAHPVMPGVQIIQAVEYREQGHQNVQPWIDSSLAALKTKSAKHIADEYHGFA